MPVTVAKRPTAPAIGEARVWNRTAREHRNYLTWSSLSSRERGPAAALGLPTEPMIEEFLFIHRCLPRDV
jgi:hypothetical protein